MKLAGFCEHRLRDISSTLSSLSALFGSSKSGKDS